MSIHIPSTLDEAREKLAGIEGILTARNWERAAIVWAFAADNMVGKIPHKISFREFAALDIIGLRDHHTVASYCGAWQQAIDAGKASPVNPGEPVEAPDMDWPPRNKHLNGVKDPERRKAIEREASAAGTSADQVARVREAGAAVAAAIKADPKIAQVAADALATSSDGRLAALNAMQEADACRLKEKGGSPVPRGEKPLEWMVNLRKAVSLAEQAVSEIAPYEGYTESQQEFINSSAKRLVSAGEWLLDNRTSRLDDEALHSWIDGERNA